MSKNFTAKWAKIPKLKQINTPNGRRYSIEGTEFKYPSITTVLDKTSDKSFLIKWRQKVGEERAKQITRNATSRGTSMHKLCELYLLNEELNIRSIEDDEFNDIGQSDRAVGEFLFAAIRSRLDSFDNIRCLETPLYSHALKVAGTVDCIAEIDGKLSIIDFKTSSKPKREEYIQNYFAQGCFYFWAYYEITGEMPEQIVILISVQDGTVQEFTLDKKEIIKHSERLKQIVELFYNNYNE